MMTSETVVLSLHDVNFSDEQFYQLCQVNRELQLERTAREELVIMPPIGALDSTREADLISSICLWNRQTKLGKVFSSSTIFRLPNGGDRSPDAAWVKNDRWESLTPEEREKFPPICPNFVLELHSRTDSLASLQAKMREYLDSGLRLGWLINPQEQQVEIYRPDRTVEIIPLPTTLSGEDVLPEFVLELPIF